MVILGVSATIELTPILSFTRVALAVNGVAFADGSNFSSAYFDEGQFVTLSTIVHVPKKPQPTTLSVVNLGDSVFTLSSAIDGDVTAFITLKKLDH